MGSTSAMEVKAMRTVMKVAVPTAMACGGVLLILGLIVWTGNGDALIPVHIAVGVVLVLSLWTIATIAARSGFRVSIAAAAAAWGVLVVMLGLAQEDLVPGRLHWTVQVVHVLVSMGAVAWGRLLAHLVQRAAATRSVGTADRTVAPQAAG
jgi:hypothetical protein